MRRIGIITNPHSKLNKRNPNIIRQLELVCRGQAEFAKTQSLKDLAKRIQSFAEKGIDVIGICGGDGTVSRTLNTIYKIYQGQALPKIAILRGGTMNVIASELKIKGRPESLLKRLLQKQTVSALETRKLSTLRVNRTIGFIYADGSNLAILEKFYLNKTGLVGAVKLGFKIVFSFLIGGKLYDSVINRKYFTSTGIADGPGSSLGNLAGTISKLPLGFPLLPLLRKNPDCFQATFVTCPKKKLLWFLPFLMLKHNDGNSLGKYSICLQELTIKFKNKIRFTLDGEIYSAPSGTINFSMGPSFEFLKL